MTYVDVTLPSLAANLALDEALLLEAEESSGPGVSWLRTWQWPTPAVVLGAAGKLAEEVHEDACRRDGVPILRRSSGGGTVLLAKGCLCFSLLLRFDRAPELAHVSSSYRYILVVIAGELSARIPGIEPAGTSDLTIRGRKFSGNSQQRKRHHLLHHGTMLYGFDLKLVERYLPLPSRQPDYRDQRSHGDFLANLPIDVDELKRGLRNAWQAQAVNSPWPEALVQRLVEEKYGKVEWLRRR